MSDTAEKLDYSSTLYLPQTDFPMRAGLPQKEPETVKRWQEMASTSACAPRRLPREIRAA